MVSVFLSANSSEDITGVNTGADFFTDACGLTIFSLILD
jgi:hypothetical protein